MITVLSQMKQGNKEAILRFKQPDYPFSLMFSCYLDGREL